MQNSGCKILEQTNSRRCHTDLAVSLVSDQNTLRENASPLSLQQTRQGKTRPLQTKVPGRQEGKQNVWPCWTDCLARNTQPTSQVFPFRARNTARHAEVNNSTQAGTRAHTALKASPPKVIDAALYIPIAHLATRPQPRRALEVQ